MRFWKKVNFDGDVADGMDSPCWLWTAATTASGYGTFCFEKRMVRAHRFAFEALRGAIPAGLHLDHLCRTPLCVNPGHLDPVTNKKNIERQVGARRDSTSGVRGVSWHTRDGKYRVQVKHDGRNHRGGYFTDIAEAELAAIALRERLFGEDAARREPVVADEPQVVSA